VIGPPCGYPRLPGINPVRPGLVAAALDLAAFDIPRLSGTRRLRAVVGRIRHATDAGLAGSLRCCVGWVSAATPLDWCSTAIPRVTQRLRVGCVPRMAGLRAEPVLACRGEDRGRANPAYAAAVRLASE